MLRSIRKHCGKSMQSVLKQPVWTGSQNRRHMRDIWHASTHRRGLVSLWSDTSVKIKISIRSFDLHLCPLILNDIKLTLDRDICRVLGYGVRIIGRMVFWRGAKRPLGTDSEIKCTQWPVLKTIDHSNERMGQPRAVSRSPRARVSLLID